MRAVEPNSSSPVPGVTSRCGAPQEGFVCAVASGGRQVTGLRVDGGRQRPPKGRQRVHYPHRERPCRSGQHSRWFDEPRGYPVGAYPWASGAIARHWRRPDEHPSAPTTQGSADCRPPARFAAASPLPTGELPPLPSAQCPHRVSGTQRPRDTQGLEHQPTARLRSLSSPSRREASRPGLGVLVRRAGIRPRPRAAAASHRGTGSGRSAPWPKRPFPLRNGAGGALPGG